ncbi:MAG TPA: hypothetical protein ENJ93_06760 [Chloroflexi bacterium]|nr:hypothetical protein [Chloroflexota bacterium]
MAFSQTTLMDVAAQGGTIITINTTADLADSTNYDNHTCNFTSGAIFFPAGDGKCTLRRAIVEAGARPDADRPITIQFNIPLTDTNYNNTLQVWEVQIDESYAWELDRRFITDDGGQVTIDGNTQPGGRSGGPKIMVNTNRDNLAIFGQSLEIRTSNNTLRNLGFIGGGQIILYEGSNLVENIWMGLKADGSGLSLASTASSQAMRSMARGGIILPNEDSDNNIIRNNRIIGAFERAIRITSSGDNNQITNNFIGMNASGLVPAPFDTGVDCTRNVAYDANLWYGGRGIQVTGSNNTITGNRFAGLHVTQAANDTPPITMEISGNGHTVTGNIIGRDTANNNIGVCGQGMLLQGTNLLVELNTIVHSRNGFDPNDDGTDFDTAMMTQSFETGSGKWITVRKNTVIDAGQSTHPDHVYRFASPGVPIELRQFNPAKVTNINGLAVSGTQGDDAVLPGPTIISAACPNCQVYLYADDLDSRIEALEFLGEATADASGNWSATLSRALTANEGLRTQSMANGNGVIYNFGTGTTSKLSDDVYTPPHAPTGITISGPGSGVIGAEHTFNITVAPITVTLPISYHIEGDVNTTDATLNSYQAVFKVTWASAGSKSFTVTADNGVSSPVMKTHTIDITDPNASSNYSVYLPLIVSQ